MLDYSNPPSVSPYIFDLDIRLVFLNQKSLCGPLAVLLLAKMIWVLQLGIVNTRS